MLSLRAHLVICGSLFATLIGVAILGGILQAAGVAPLRGKSSVIALVLFFGLFVAFGLSTIPVMVKLVLGTQRQLGNEAIPIVGAALQHETAIVWAIWGVMLLGLAIAIPAALMDGFFGPGPTRSANTWLAGKSKGTLAGKPGMTFEELVQGSSLEIDTDARRPITGAAGGGGVFDFEIPGTGMRFERCRTYFASPDSHDPSRIASMAISISPEKLTRAEADAADLDLGSRLAADGWLTGHEVYRTEEDRTLHGGATQGPSGNLWLKDGLVLSIQRSRMDDERPGEDPMTAGEWVQSINLWPRADYPCIERFEFAAP